MSRLFVALAVTALFSLAVLAQPPQPFTVLTADSGSSFSDLHLAMRDTGACDIFYVRTTQDNVQRVEHAVVSLTTQSLLHAPEIMSAHAGWQPQIADAQSDGNHWAALIYEKTPFVGNISLNRTSLMWGLDTTQGSMVLDTSRWYDYLIWGVVQAGDHWNMDLTLRTSHGGDWIASWIVGSVSVWEHFYEMQNSWHTSNVWSGFSGTSDLTQPCRPYQFGPSRLRTAIASNSQVFGLLGNLEMPVDTSRLFVFTFNGEQHCRGRILDSTLSFLDIWHLYDAHFMMVARAVTTPAPWELYDIDTTGQCVYMNSVQLPEIAATAWQPTIGLAAIQVTPQIIMLARFTTSGGAVWPPGVFHESDNLHPIREANTVIAANRKVVMLWSESEAAAQNPTTLKMARVGWSTFLGVDGPRVISEPSSFALAAFPNPFNPRTELRFSLPEAGEAALRIYDIQGRLTQELISGRLARGEHQVSFDARALPSGIYFARLSAGRQQATQKLLLVR